MAIAPDGSLVLIELKRDRTPREVVAQALDYATWVQKLQPSEVAELRILERIDRLAHGNPGDVKPVGQGVSELRVTYGPGYRVYYLQGGDRLVLLLCGGDKSTQQKDIEKAYKLAEEWRSEEENDGDEE